MQIERLLLICIFFRIQVDVTNLLSDEAGNYLTPDENENPKKLSGDEKYQSAVSERSSASSDESSSPHSASNQDKDPDNLTDEVQNDWNNLAAILQQASQMPAEGDENQKNLNDDTPKKLSIEEVDDTSRCVFGLSLGDDSGGCCSFTGVV